MKQFLLVVFLLTGLVGVEAQIASGEKLTGNIEGTDIKGNAVNIFADLDAGKTVVLDVFATWCGPCWSFHNAGVLKELNKLLGPTGTNQIRIYAIEGDARTPEGHLYKQVAGTSTVPSSLGDWTKDVDYGIVNSDAYNTLLKIAFFPTLYVIRPDRTVLEMGSFRYNPQIWQKALVPTAAKDLVFSTKLEDRTFCSTAVYNQKPKVINMGTSTITAGSVELLLNTTKSSVNLSAPLGVFQEAEVPFTNKTLIQPTDVTVTIKNLDGVADEADDLSTLTCKYVQPKVIEKKMTLKVTTDFYPGEFSWNLKDNKNRTLKSATYRPGNADADGGGGDDANKEFVYDIDITNTDINCLTMTLLDSYGDGNTAFNPSTHPVPGVEFLDAAGNVIKPKLLSEYNYQSTTKSFAQAVITSSLADQDFVENLRVYPNPATDILSIDMTLRSGLDFEIFITDVMGAQVTNVSKNTNFIPVGNLTTGVYFLNVRTSDGLYTHKFTKM